MNPAGTIAARLTINAYTVARGFEPPDFKPTWRVNAESTSGKPNINTLEIATNTDLGGYHELYPVIVSRTALASAAMTSAQITSDLLVGVGSEASAKNSRPANPIYPITTAIKVSYGFYQM